MINRQEILDFSREFGLRPDIVEKDYVLGWLLAGISNHKELFSTWAFKGGTCLKKCFFETYRFSEDLDFTIIDLQHFSADFLSATFVEISEWIYEETGIELPKELIRFDIYTNQRGKLSAEGRISYRGPLQLSPRRDLPRIKLDLTNDEILVLEPESHELHHPYSDTREESTYVRCYKFEELFAEKLRALAERLRPRDLYDVIHLYRHADENTDRALILSTLKKKCEFKGIQIPTIESLEKNPERSELQAEWENMLGHQLPTLPPFDQFWNELPVAFKWLYQTVEKIVFPPMPRMGIAVDEAWTPPTLASVWHTSTPLEIVRFAAANQLCVDLIYNGSHRLIEPYSLRTTRDGNLLLYAVKHFTGEDRSYRVDRIQNATVTTTPFTPRYTIELTASGPLSTHSTKSKEAGLRGFPSSNMRSFGPSFGKAAQNFGPKYIFRCSVCGKQFSHKSYEASLNRHKNKQGYPCPGRLGIYVSTKY